MPMRLLSWVFHTTRLTSLLRMGQLLASQSSDPMTRATNATTRPLYPYPLEVYHVPLMTGKTHPVNVHILPLDSIICDEALNRAYESVKSSGGAVGLDAEWRPEYERGVHHKVALLQLAVREDIFLLRLLHLEGPIPPALNKLLTDSEIPKVGVNVHQDCKRLYQDYGLASNCMLDVREIAQNLGLSLGKKKNLGAMAMGLLGVVLDKSQQCSDWALKELSRDQLVYAALDAWASASIVEVLHRHYERTNRAKDAEWQPRTVAGFCQDIFVKSPSLHRKSSVKPHLNKPLKSHINKPSKSHKKSTTTTPPSQQPPPPTVITSKIAGLPRGGHSDMASTSSTPSSGRVKHGHQLRHGILYENYRVLAPDGELLCTCSRSKVEWYVSRGLGTLEAGDELDEASGFGPAVRLSFEPKSRRSPGDDYILTAKCNKCVKCGVAGNYLRHHVVPQVYRKHFPAAFKSHINHDIVLMCIDCHAQCDGLVQQQISELADRWDAPLDSKSYSKYLVDARIESLRKSAFLLLRHADKLPVSKRQEHEDVLKAYLQSEGDAPLDSTALEGICRLDPQVANPSYVGHGERVVGCLLAQGEAELASFIRGWRRLFLSFLGPNNHLPPHWSVDQRVKRDLSVEEEEEEASRCMVGGREGARNTL